MLKIAWRNILRHKGKSLVIGVILFIGAFLMTVGNGIITGMDYGVKKNIVNSFMGDIVIISDKQKSDNILFSMMGTSIEPINTYKQIKEVLESRSYVERFLPAGDNLAMILKEDQNTPSATYLMGVDFAKYQKMFPNSYKVIEGRQLLPGDKHGIMVPTHIREEHIYTALNVWLIPEGSGIVKENLTKEARENLKDIVVSSSIVLMGTASGVNSSTDLRFGVKGIIKYRALNSMFGHFCVTDIESYRECMGYFSAAENAIEVPKEEKKLLQMENSDMDSLFGSEPLVVSDTKSKPKLLKPKVAAPEVKADSEFGTYNMVFVKLKNNITYNEALSKLNKALLEKGAGVRAITWNRASGPIGSMTLIIKSALFLFVMLLFVVAIIIIINTLTMAALERTSEIGMMRAVGAKKSFITGMFFGETGMLSTVFGGAGIVLGVITVKLIPLFKITTSNDLVQLLYGGDIFRPMLMVPDIALTVAQLALVTIAAAFYPVSVARNITPLDAIQRD